MALRPSQSHKPSFTKEDVIQIRKRYYYEKETYRSLADAHDVSPRVIEKVVKGIGKFYGSIEDNISQETKENHEPVRNRFAQVKKDSRALDHTQKYYGIHFYGDKRPYKKRSPL